MYHFDPLQLRVSRNISLEPKNKNLLKNTRLIVLEHILPTTEEFLNVLKEAGCEIGSHSRKHNYLPTLNDDELADEIGGSKRDLEKIIRDRVSIESSKGQVLGTSLNSQQRKFFCFFTLDPLRKNFFGLPEKLFC